MVNCKNVITIHSNGRHAIGNTSSHDTITGILIIDRCGYGIHVISAIEKSLTSQGRRKVQSRMEITLWGSSLSEVSDSDAIISSDSKVVAGTRSLWYLGAERRRDSTYIHVFGAIVDWHLFTFAKIILVTRELMPHLLDRKTTPKEGTCLTVLWENQVLILKCSCCADTRSFFTQLSHIERDSCLTLRGVVHCISFVNGDHVVIHFEQ